jgi:uncharacterized peroxidase-related enzyme
MRLAKLDNGHSLGRKLFLLFIRIVSRRRPPDVVKSLVYRTEFWGKRYNALLEAAMRGPSSWEIWERELMAAFTSRLNECEFWIRAHGAVASLASKNPEAIAAVLRDYTTAPIREPLRAMLRYLDKVTRAPEQVSAADLAPLRAQGLDDEAIVDALRVCTLFNLINRAADAFGWEPQDEGSTKASANALLSRGYLL